jgi:electron transport complex protein RnfG
MSQTSHPIMRSSVLLGLIALLGTALLAGVNNLTYNQIAEQEKQRVLQQLNEIVPVATFDNDLLTDVIEIDDKAYFDHQAPVLVYRARMGSTPVAVMMIVTAPDGYNGDIKLLAGISAGGEILGVRVISHKETPGLGDPIDIKKSDWINGFTARSLNNPVSSGWAVKRDGGQFDQFTGATITPRAVVKIIHNTLLYYEINRQRLFDTPAKAINQNGK